MLSVAEDVACLCTTRRQPVLKKGVVCLIYDDDVSMAGAERDEKGEPHRCACCGDAAISDEGVSLLMKRDDGVPC